jgi:curved DNA-binding protein CbpA
LTPDHYAVLGISETASSQEVKGAFRVLAREWHPDQLGPNATKAQRDLTEDRYKEISEAYDVLSDPELRRRYDLRRRATGGAPREAETAGQTGQPRSAPRQATPPPEPPPRQDQAPRVPFGPTSPSVDRSGRGNLVAGGVFSAIWYFVFAEGLNGFAAWYNPVALMPVVIWLVVEIRRYRRNRGDRKPISTAPTRFDDNRP